VGYFTFWGVEICGKGTVVSSFRKYKNGLALASFGVDMRW
jgi:hypothetical protein